MGSAASNPQTVGDAVKTQKEKIDEAHKIMNRGLENHSKSGQSRQEVATKKTEELNLNAAKALDADRLNTKNLNDSISAHKMDWANKQMVLRENGEMVENSAMGDMRPLVRSLVTDEINKLTAQMDELLAETQAATAEAQREVAILDEHVQKKIPEVKQRSQAAMEAFVKDCEAVRKKVQEAEDEAIKRMTVMLEEITKLDVKMNANVDEVEKEQRRTDEAVRTQMRQAEESVRKATGRLQTLLATREKNFKQTLHEVQMAVDKARDIRAEKALQEEQKHNAANFGFNVLNTAVKVAGKMAS